MLQYSLKILLFHQLMTMSASASPLPTVVWLQTDWAPHQIVAGTYAGQGTFDILQQRIADLLPQFHHQSRLTSFGRVESYFQQRQETVCMTGVLHSAERAQSRYFSLPMAVGPGMAINFMRNSPVASYLDEHWQIDINTLIEQAELKGAYQPNRFYSPVLLDAFASSTAHLIPTEFTTERNAVSLLHSKRVDYVIEYPERMQFYQAMLQEKAEPVVSAAVKYANPYSVSYVSCNKSIAGDQVITAINEILPTLWQAQDFQDVLFLWLDENARNILMPKFKELLQQMSE